MSSAADNAAICIALLLAGAAAILTTPAQPAESYHKLQWLVSVSAAPDVAVMEGAVGTEPGFPVSP
jgi:hypothetical protein